MPLLEAVHYDAVRAALDPHLSADDLSDAVIALDIYAGDAEDEILSRDANAETYSETGTAAEKEKWRRVRRAAVYLTAARILPALPQLLEQRLGGHVTQRFAETDIAARVADLRALADSQLAAYLETDGATVKPFMFGVATGKRGF